MNMSYCRFENTNRDLNDCLNATHELFDSEGKALSPSETEAAVSLVRAASELLQRVAEECGLDVDELLDSPQMDKHVGDAFIRANRCVEAIEREGRGQ